MPTSAVEVLIPGDFKWSNSSGTAMLELVQLVSAYAPADGMKPISTFLLILLVVDVNGMSGGASGISRFLPFSPSLIGDVLGINIHIFRTNQRLNKTGSSRA